MLRTSRFHPQISAFHVLEGQHDFNKVPFGPPGIRATIFNPPETRGSFRPRALEGWYIGPAWDHYRSMNFQIPSTGGYRTAAQYHIYPNHVKASTETPMDRAVRIAVSLTRAIQKILKEPSISTGQHIQALEQLTKIFETATEKLETRHEHRVQTSSTPTTKANIRTDPRVHSRVTRNNTPGITLLQNATPIANTEGGKEFPPPAPISEGGQNSEGGHKSVRKRTNKPRSSKERRKTKQSIHSPVERVAQPVSARETRKK